MRTAVFPGTFDPITNGHVDIARRAARLFDHVVLGVFDQSGGSKRVLFSTGERVQLARASLADIPNVSVRSYSGLTVDFAHEVGALVIVRGVRAMTDFEQEFPQAFMHRQLRPELDVVWLVTDPRYTFVSSTLLKEVASLGGDVGELVPAPVGDALRGRIGASRAPSGARHPTP